MLGTTVATSVNTNIPVSICSPSDSSISPLIFSHIPITGCFWKTLEGAEWGAERTAKKCQRKWGSGFILGPCESCEVLGDPLHLLLFLRKDLESAFGL